MGTILDKLNHLKSITDSIVEKFDNVFAIGGFKVGQLTLKEKVETVLEWLNVVYGSFLPTGYNKSLAVEHTLADGTKKIFNNCITSYFTAPKIYYSSTVKFPFTISGEGSASVVSRIRHLDFSGYINKDDNSATYFLLACRYVYVESLIMPERFALMSNTFFGYNARYMFEHGLRLGRVSKLCGSNWLNSASITDERYVDCMDNFEGTMYLSKIGMSAETMVRLFNKLKDLTGTGEKYTFNVGSTNLAKLTDEQKNIAISKGWDIN